MTTKTVAIKAIAVEKITVRIVGKTPLVTHQFPKKGLRQIRDKKMGVKTKTREKCDPEEECRQATYFLSDGTYGFPAPTIRKAIVAAAHRDIGIEKTVVRKGLFVLADESFLCRIECESGPKMREDVVRVGMGSADLRYRPEFFPWAIQFTIEYDTDWLTAETIVNLIERAGFGIGIGEWRPQCDGELGRFAVERGSTDA